MFDQILFPIEGDAADSATVAFTALRSFIENLEERGRVGEHLRLGRQLLIICPDCGQNEAYRGRCPKCGGASWLPAGLAGGVFERLEIQRRQMRNSKVRPGYSESIPRPDRPHRTRAAA